MLPRNERDAIRIDNNAEARLVRFMRRLEAHGGRGRVDGEGMGCAMKVEPSPPYFVGGIVGVPAVVERHIENWSNCDRIGTWDWVGFAGGIEIESKTQGVSKKHGKTL